MLWAKDVSENEKPGWLSLVMASLESGRDFGQE